MRIFLTGGTGYVGSAVLDALVRGGHHVDALVRTTDAAADVQRRGTPPILGDILQPATWRDAAAAADAIVHAAAEDGPRVRTVDEAALNVIAELPPRDGRVVVYTSGIWVLGAAPHRVDESAPTNAVEHVAWRPEHEARVLNGGTSGAARGRRAPWHPVRRPSRHRRRPVQRRAERPGARDRHRREPLAARLSSRRGRPVSPARQHAERVGHLPRDRRRRRTRQRDRVGARGAPADHADRPARAAGRSAQEDGHRTPRRSRWISAC